MLSFLPLIYHVCIIAVLISNGHISAGYRVDVPEYSEEALDTIEQQLLQLHQAKSPDSARLGVHGDIPRTEEFTEGGRGFRVVHMRVVSAGGGEKITERFNRFPRKDRGFQLSPIRRVSGRGHIPKSAQKQGPSGVSHSVPEFHLKKRKDKSKIISIDKGFYIAGGSRVFGKFPTLKSCMKGCSGAPSCFAGDYNPWLQKCYFHTNTTACRTMAVHTKLTHFKKVPCTIDGVENFRITLGASLVFGFFIKGIDNIQDCLKHCLNSGDGVANSAIELILNPLYDRQICFGIDYDFATHKCFLHTFNIRRPQDFNVPLCEFVAPSPVRTPLDLQPKDSVVNIILCPPAV